MAILENQPKVTESEGVKPKGTKRKKPGTDTIQHQRGKPDWKKVRQDAIKMKDKRKSKNETYTLGQEMKHAWEELRVDKCSAERRQQLVMQLLKGARGHLLQLARTHDTSRICETLYELGGENDRAQMFSELKDNLLTLSRDKYARHLLLKILSYGPQTHKDAIGAAFRGRVTTAASQKFSGEVLETYFRDCASSEQRNRLVMEFYGSEFFLLSTASLSLAELVKHYPEKRPIYLTNVRSQLQVLLDKQLLNTSLSHRILREYMEVCPEAERPELVVSLRELLANMLHTRDGARIACLCIWWATVKDRKVIVKSFKTFVTKICTDQHGYFVMLTLLNCVDDTKLVKKALLEELLSGAVQIAEDEHGRKVLHFLMSGRDTRYLHPQLVCSLAEGDGSAASRKDAPVRQQELLEGVGERLLLTASLHCPRWICDSKLCVLLTHICCSCSGGALQSCLTQVARLTAEPLTIGDTNHLINNSASYMQLKKLIQADAQRSVSVFFSTLMLDALSAEQLNVWLGNNRAVFLLVIMLETEVDVIVEKLVSLLTPLYKKIKPVCKGAEILKKKLKPLVS